MAYFYLFVRAENVSKSADIAKQLGWNGICIVLPYERAAEITKIKSKIEKLPVDIAFGIEIEEKNISNIKKLVAKFRRRVEVILVKSGDIKFNRQVVEIPEVDILSGTGRVEKEIDYVSAKIAKKNNVAIELGFKDLSFSHKTTRERRYSNYLDIAKIVKKSRAPFVLTSYAFSPWDLRSPNDLMSFGTTMGFGKPECKRAVSDKIVKENRKRLSGKWIMPGVELE